AREEAAGEGEVGDDLYAAVVGEGNDVLLDLAAEDAVVVLGADVVLGAKRPGRVDVVHHVPGLVVGSADLTDFAGLYQVVHRTEDFILMDVEVGLMELPEVDVVGLELAQAVVAALMDVIPGPHVAHAAEVVLGGDDPLIAAALEAGAYVLLRV